MEAFLTHSQKTYIPLPLELRVRRPRSRANSRPTPYPKGGPAKLVKGAVAAAFTRHARTESGELAFQCISPFSHPPSAPTARPVKETEKVAPASPAAPILATLAPLSPFSVNFQSAKASLAEELLKVGPPRARVNSNVRRSALGWSRRKPSEKDGNEGNDKENKPVVVVDVKKSANTTLPAANSSAVGKENRENEAHGMLTR